MISTLSTVKRPAGFSLKAINHALIGRVVAGVLFITLLLASCMDGDIMGTKHHHVNADSLFEAAHHTKDYEAILNIADSLERMGAVSEAKAYYWRGYATDRMGQKHAAEYHWKKALAAVKDFNNESEVAIYTKTASRLANLLNMKGDYERSLQLTMPTAERIESIHADTTADYANLLIFIGCCQSRFGKADEAMTNNFAHAYEKHLEFINRNHSDDAYKSAIAGLLNIAYYSFTSYRDGDALLWIARLDTMLNEYKLHPYATADYLDRQEGRLQIYRATALEHLGRYEESSEAYNAFLNTHLSEEADGLFLAGDYLVAAQRWKEATVSYQNLDEVVNKYHLDYTLDNIQNVFLKKYYANLGVGKMDSVLAISMKICNELNEAINNAKSNDAAELATIYDTQQKEAEIANQRKQMARQRQWNIIIAMTLLFLVFVVVSVNRHLHARKIDEQNKLLAQANARAEESSRMKTKFIQQISHEIRTPLNILSGFTQVITQPDMELDNDTKKDINAQITENTKRITSLVNKMLDLSDAGSSAEIEHKDNVPAFQVATQATDTSGIAKSKHITLDIQLSPEVEELNIQTNLNAATRALSLLLDNARKFTKAPEAQSSDASATTEKKSVVLSLKATAEKVEYIVEDTGIGVPPEEAEHIFEEFVQLNDYYDGTGIGLTVARSLARRLGGDIVLDTTYTNGARFVMTLPVK